MILANNSLNPAVGWSVKHRADLSIYRDLYLSIYREVSSMFNWQNFMLSLSVLRKLSVFKSKKPSEELTNWKNEYFLL